jgi:hypothetical protein
MRWPTAWVDTSAVRWRRRSPSTPAPGVHARAHEGRARRGLLQGQSSRVAGEPGPQRVAGHGNHAHRRRPRGRRGRAGHLALANVGDSRAYLFSEDRIVQVTADHSLAEERMRHGEITEEEAAVHPQRHILTRALGISPKWKPTCGSCSFAPATGSCSVATGSPTSSATRRWPKSWRRCLTRATRPTSLVDIANEHGGSDNITVIVVDVLVGEETTADASVIMPIGTRAGAPLVVGREPVPVWAPRRHVATAAWPRAPGSGFTGPASALSGNGPPAGNSSSTARKRFPWPAPPPTGSCRRRRGWRTRSAQREPRCPPAAAGDPPADHGARGPLRPPGGRDPDGGVLRHPLVRLRQLVRLDPEE